MILREDLCIRDPFIYKENGIYYLYGSLKNDGSYNRFSCYTSKDLKQFEGPYIIFEPDDDFWAKKDYWAPEMHKYNNKYYLFGSLKEDNKCRGTQIFVSDNPKGNFVPLTKTSITPNDWECLDGTLYVENDIPYIIFCREWLEVKDGEIYVAELSKDLKRIIGEPKKLFSASEAKWPVPFSNGDNYVTDGPFIIKKDKKLQMIWSSFAKNGYAIGLCESESIFGPWKHQEEPIFSENGGHAMVFESDNKLIMAFHLPNDPDNEERLCLKEYKY